MTLRHALKTTYAAFAARASSSRALVRRPNTISGSCSSLRTSFIQATFTSTRLFSSFQPAPPPGTRGTPVFPDIDFSVASDPSSEAVKRNSDENAVFVVTGASRGIGLQFVKSLMDRTKGTIVACCRSPETALGLKDYQSSLETPSRLQLVQLDLEDQESVEQAGTQVREKFDRVDLLLNVAGILGDAKTSSGPERSLQKMDRAWLEKSLAVNLVGPVMWTKELAPLMMQRGRPKKNEQQRPIAVVANLSARVGSISDNRLGGWYSYRMSKAALNQATRTMALEFARHKAWSIALHPGTTDTDLSVPFQANVKEGSLFPVDFSVQQLLDIIDSMTDKHSGGFFDWSGQSLSF